MHFPSTQDMDSNPPPSVLPTRAERDAILHELGLPALPVTRPTPVNLPTTFSEFQRLTLNDVRLGHGPLTVRVAKSAQPAAPDFDPDDSDDSDDTPGSQVDPQVDPLATRLKPRKITDPSGSEVQTELLEVHHAVAKLPRLELLVVMTKEEIARWRLPCDVSELEAKKKMARESMRKESDPAKKRALRAKVSHYEVKIEKARNMTVWDFAREAKKASFERVKADITSIWGSSADAFCVGAGTFNTQLDKLRDLLVQVGQQEKIGNAMTINTEAGTLKLMDATPQIMAHLRKMESHAYYGHVLMCEGKPAPRVQFNAHQQELAHLDAEIYKCRETIREMMERTYDHLETLRDAL